MTAANTERKRALLPRVVSSFLKAVTEPYGGPSNISFIAASSKICQLSHPPSVSAQQKWEPTGRIRCELAPVRCHVKLDSAWLVDGLQLSFVTGSPSQVFQLGQDLDRGKVVENIDFLAETLVRAFAKGNVRLKRSVEAYLQPEQTVRTGDRIIYA